MGRRWRSMSSSDKDFGVVILNNFITKEEADYIIDLYENLDESEIYEDLNKNRKITVNPNNNEFKKTINKVYEKAKEIFSDRELYVTEFMISSYKPGYSMGVHSDIIGKEHFSVSAVLYLNSEFTGGDIVFPVVDKKHAPKLGDLALFDSKSKENNHGVEVVTSGIRYVMPIWITSDRNKALKFIHN